MSNSHARGNYSKVDGRESLDRPSDEKINKMYSTVLEQTLTPPNIRDQLIESQSIEQKWKLVQVHKDIFEKSTPWGVKENALLSTIESSPVPDIKALSNLKVILSSANIDFMKSFLKANGIVILIKAVESQLKIRSLTELDVAILFEIMLCFKLIMNNSTGMEGFLAVDGCIDTIARCLHFEYKFFALQILEMLSACCYTESTTEMVIHGMRLLARKHQEPPFHCLVQAIETQDIEVKAAVMRFITSMTSGADFDDFTLLRSDLTAQMFSEKYDEASRSIEAELQLLINGGFIAPVSPSNKTPRGAQSPIGFPSPNVSEKSGSGPNSDRESLARPSYQQQMSWQPTDLVSLGPMESLYGSEGSKTPAVSTKAPVKSLNVRTNVGAATMKVTPGEGTMAGVLTTVSLQKSCMGNKTLEHKRWYELTDNTFKCCYAIEKSAVFEQQISISNITDIRLYTTNLLALKLCEEKNHHAFEVETNTGVVYVLTTETKAEKQNWLLAFVTCRDEYTISKSAYKMQVHSLQPKDVLHYATVFKKLGADYQKFVIEQQKFSIEHCGIDVSDAQAIFSFLQKELFASGLNSKFLAIMQEFMLIPSGSEVTWDAVLTGVQKLRRVNLSLSEYGNLDDTFDDKDFAAMLQWKAEEGGSDYKQISKLALASMESEQQVLELTRKLAEVEEQRKGLTKHKIVSALKTMPISTDTEVLRLTSKVKILEDTFTLKDQEVEKLLQEMSTLKEKLDILMKENEDLKTREPAVVYKTVYKEVGGLTVASGEDNKGENSPGTDKLSRYNRMRSFGSSKNIGLSSAAEPVSTAIAAEGDSGAGAAAVVVVDDRFVKYDKMKKMLPEGAVRQKMMTEGVPQSDIDAYFDGTLVRGGSPAAVAVPAPVAPVADERYAKFDRMRKMLPEGAVRQKMKSEGFTEDEIESYILNGAPTVAGNTAQPAATAAVPAAPVVDPRYEKFEKMRKMLPEGAVRQKMQTEGFTPDEIESYFTNGPPMIAGAASSGASAAVAAPPVPTLIPDERYAKFDRMRKMLPEGAVRQKMKSEGFTEEEIDSYIANGAPMVMGVAPAGTGNGTGTGSGTGSGSGTGNGNGSGTGGVGGGAAPVAPASEEDRYARFEKMKKMLPEGAVRQKMKTEGFTPEEIDKFFGGKAAAPVPAAAKKLVPAVETPPEDMSVKPIMKPNIKLKNLFWNKLPAGEIKGTIWHKMSEFTLPEDDIKKMEDCFAAKVTAVNTSASAGPDNSGAASGNATSTAAPVVKLISALDAKRTQNVLIVMGRIRKGPEEIMNIIVDLDTSVLTHDLCGTIISILPTAEELAVIQQYKDPSLLDNASKLYFHFNRIPRLNMRIECHEIAYTWHGAAVTSMTQLNIIQRACTELNHSQTNLQTLLSMILAIGNYINGDTKFGQAYGVKLDTFLKLTALKAGVATQGTLMNYLGLLAERHSPELLAISEGWIGIWAAAELSLTQIKNDINQLDNQVNKMNTEFLRIRDAKENIGLDGKLEDARGHCTNPLYRRLDGFLHDAKSKLFGMKTQSVEVESAVEALMLKYGENMKTLSDEDHSKKFFTTISTFAKSFRTAVDENIRRRLAAEKAARLAEAANKRLEAKKTAQNVGFVDQEAKGAGTGKKIAFTAMRPGSVRHRGASSAVPAQNNIFDRFHSAQEESTEEVVEKFRAKLHKSQRLVPSDVFGIDETKDE